MSTSGSGYQWIIIKFCFTGDIIFSIPLDLDLSLRNSNSGLEVNQAPTTTGLCNEGIIHWQMQCWRWQENSLESGRPVSCQGNKIGELKNCYPLSYRESATIKNLKN